MYLLFDGCDYFISQKQEEGNITWETIGVNRARQVFKNRRPIFRNSCNWERDTLDVKEVLGRTQVSEEVSRAETDRGGTSWVLYLCWSKSLLEKNKTSLFIPLVVDIL